MKRFFLVVLIVLTGLALYSCATMNSVVPLPNILIVSPDPNLPPEIKAFSGKWGGSWWYQPNPSSGRLDAVLIIEGIMDEQATVVYGWGNNPGWSVKEGWARFTVNFSRNKEGKITLSWIDRRTGSKFEFQVKGDELKGVAGGNTYITMKRLQ